MERAETGRSAAELVDVCLDIRGKRILQDVTWDIGPGEKWVVLGLNGSGKTSLLRLLSGFGYPSRGTMRVFGESYGRVDLRELRRRIGWVHGDLAGDFPRFMSCREVVESGEEGSIAVYEEMDRKVVRRAEEALEAIAAAHLADRLFCTLSTGERQRVLIARALAARPDLLLLDEPCLGLDPLAREEFLHSLSVLFAAQTGLTVIAVTHHVEEIIDGYGRMLLLAGGRIAAQGARHEVLMGSGISAVYGPRCRVEYREGRYAMYFAGG